MTSRHRSSAGPRRGATMIDEVLDLRRVDRTRLASVGGKAATLGELSGLAGVVVPDGFCVTTEAFRRVLARLPGLDARLDRLSPVDPGDRESLAAHCRELRRAVEDVAIPADLAAAITGAVSRLGEGTACAVRSSATAEDLPGASFAGQHDSFLDVVGAAEVLRHVRRCWASLFTERAVAYRQAHGVDHRGVSMAVVVQRMLHPQAAGVLFTADPVTGHRRVTAVEAVPGLGEGLVSGLVTPDSFTVRDGEVVAQTPAAERRGSGTVTLDRAHLLHLADLGRRIEAHFGCPQDIEWCLVEGAVRIVQSRPITTLFPIPEAGDGGNHVYLSVGHQQMMTEPMRPLGLSTWQLTALAPMHEAGGRLFVDATRHLSSPARAGFLELVGRSDPLTRDALQTLLDRGFVPPPDGAPPAPARTPAGPTPLPTDPAVVTELIERSRTALSTLRDRLAGVRGPELFDVLQEAFEEHRRLLTDPLSMQAITAGMEASWWLADRLGEWLGEPEAVDTLTLSAPGNVTSEMGLALLDVADAVRPHPEVIAYLRDAGDDLLDRLPRFAGGVEVRDAVAAYLDRYGMRCPGEIDITRPRWRERPSTLVPLILDHVRNFAPGAAAQRFEQGRQRAEQKALEVLERLRALPDGERKAAETERMIERVRTFTGYREYPKYAIVSRYQVYREALLGEAERLRQAGVIADPEDVGYLTFQEFRDAVRSQQVDAALVRRRREAFHHQQALTPPRVLTSDGEVLDGDYRRDDVPPGALVGLPVSAGTVEGRARVVLDPAGASLEPGDILVTAHTDPSWTPLFVTVAGLVTEVGGRMTHGAVIAREYGLPAVVSVPGATRRIPDGRRIRVHGGAGYVELLP